MKRRAGMFILGALVLFPGLLAAQEDTRSSNDIKLAVRALSAKIDALIEAKWKGADIHAAPLASDTQFYRRVNLDIIGKIPNLQLGRDFLDDMTQHEWSWLADAKYLEDERFEKRFFWVEKLIDSPDYAKHWAAVWRAILIPSGSTNAQTAGQMRGFGARVRA